MANVDSLHVTPAGASSQGHAFGVRGPATTLARRALSADRLSLALAIGAPALLTVYLSFNEGGYFPLPPALGATGLALVLGVRTVAARRREGRPRAGVFVFVGALGLLAGWELLSGSWSHSPGRALIVYDRTLMYGLAAAVAGSVGYTAGRLRAAVYVFLGAMVAVCAVAFIAGTVPELWHPPRPLYSSRLSYPLEYANALGILAAVATVLAFHVSCCGRSPRAARIAAAAATPLSAATLYMTLSRGAAWSAALALAVYILVGRPRELSSGLVAVVPTTGLALAATALIGFRSTPPSGSLIPGGHAIAAIMAVTVALAGLLRAAGLNGKLRLPQIELPAVRRRNRAALIGLLAMVMLAATAIYVDRFAQAPASQASRAAVGNGAARLTSVNPDGRLDFWKVALRDARAQPLHGLGAGMYAVSWAASSNGDTVYHDAHSLYLQMLAELGLVGLVLLLLAMGALAVGLIRRAREHDRALFAALLAAGLAWAISAAVEWDWEMPAVTLWLFALGGLALGAAPVRRSLRRDATTPSRWRVRAAEVLNRARWPLRTASALACLALAVTPAAMAISQYRLQQSIHALNTSCARARGYAQSSLGAVGGRPEPYQILGFCDLGAGRPLAALREMRRALARDPQNWQLQYSVAVAIAATGRDPRAAIEAADKLAPMEPMVIHEAVRLLAHRQNSGGWRRLAAEAWLPLPLVPLAPNNGPQFQEGTFLPPMPGLGANPYRSIDPNRAGG